MSNLSQIKADSNWGDVSNTINTNFQNMDVEVEKLKNSTTRFKGYFTNETNLKNKFPSPKRGDIAFVGEPYPGNVYDVLTDGSWHNTNKAPETGSVDLQDYVTLDDFEASQKEQDDKLTELEKNGMKYVSTNLISGMLEGKDVGGIIDIDSPTPNGFMKHCIIDCVAGDMFLVQGKGATNGRLWAFLDATNKIISVDNIRSNDRFQEPLTIIAPDEASKLICNFNVIDYPSSGTAKYVNAIPDIVTNAKKVQTQQDSLEAKSRKYFSDNLSFTNQIEELESKQGIFNNGTYRDNSLFISKKYKIDKELLYSVTTTTQERSSGYQLVTFFDAKDKYISSFYDVKEYASLTKECINIPSNADYFYLTGLNNKIVIAEELINSNYNLEEVGKLSDSLLEKKNIEFVSGAYVTSSVEVGRVFDYKVSPNDSVTCAIVSISKDDIITLTAKEVSIHARAYIFLDKDKRVLP